MILVLIPFFVFFFLIFAHYDNCLWENENVLLGLRVIIILQQIVFSFLDCDRRFETTNKGRELKKKIMAT